MAITWRNVNSPMAGFQVAGDLFQNAGQSINTGLGAFNTILQDRQKLDEANRLNAQSNVVADFRNYMSSLRNEGVDALQGADHQASLQDIMARRGISVAPRELDIAAEARTALTGAQTDAITNRDFTQGEALAAANPVLQDYRARLLRDPNATLSEEETNTLRSGNLLDDAMEFQDSRKQTVDQRGRDVWRFDNEQKDALSKYANQDSQRKMGEILAEEMAAGRARGLDDRTIMDNAFRRASDPESGVLPEHLSGFRTSSRGALDADFSPTAEEQQLIDLQKGLNDLSYEQQMSGIQSNLSSLDEREGYLSPFVTGADLPTMDMVMERMYTDNKSIRDTGDTAFSRAIGPLGGPQLDAIVDVFSNTANRDLSRILTRAAPSLKKFREQVGEINPKFLDNMNDEQVLLFAMDLARKGQKGEGKLDLNQVENLIPTAIASLRDQYKERNKIQKERENLTKSLQEAQRKQYEINANILRGRGG